MTVEKIKELIRKCESAGSFGFGTKLPEDEKRWYNNCGMFKEIDFGQGKWLYNEYSAKDEEAKLRIFVSRLSEKETDGIGGHYRSGEHCFRLDSDSSNNPNGWRFNGFYWKPQFSILFRYGTKTTFIEYRMTYAVNYKSYFASLVRLEIIHVNEKSVTLAYLGTLNSKVEDIFFAVDERSFDSWCERMGTWYVPEYEKFQKKLEIPEELRKLEAQLGGFEVEKNNISAWWQMYRQVESFRQTGKIPDMCFLGPAGSGKKRMSESLARLFNAKTYIKTPSDLKGAYVGQTQAKVYDCFREIIEDRKWTGKKILLIDEVYSLMSDDFGREAASILIPLLSGDKEEIERGKDENEEVPPPPKINFKNAGISIWIMGYEIPTRQMLQKNLGLYRRLETITLKTPSVDRLMETLKKNLKISLGDGNMEKILNFVSWATSPERASYFSNYAGIEKLCKVLNTIDVSKADFSEKVDAIISEKRHEIEAQYSSALLMSKEDRKGTYVEIPLFKTSCDLSRVEVIGYEGVTDKLNVIGDMIFDKKELKDKGIAVPKGLLFVGPPGVGKSYLARYLAYRIQEQYRSLEDKDHRVGFIPLVATELDSTDKVNKLFETAKQFDDCIIFIDELDAIGMERDNNPYRNSMLRLLTCMDGFDGPTGIFVLAATNAPDSLDPALKRPGRFDRIVEIDVPEVRDREALIRYYLGKTSLRTNLTEDGGDMSLCDMDTPADDDASSCSSQVSAFITFIARQMAGFSAAEIKTVINNAAIEMDKALSHDMESWKKELINQIDTFLIGDKKDDTEHDEIQEFSLNENEGQSATAIHEVGHGLMSVLEYGEKPFAEITVVPRGDCLGYVKRSEDEKKFMTKETLLKDVRIKLAGRAAEEIFYGRDRVSVGAIQDLSQATKIVRNMVCYYGMSESIGPMALISTREGYLSSEVQYICSPEMRLRAEEEILRILQEQYRITLDTLSRDRDRIETMARKVFEAKSMTGEEFMDMAG